MVRIMRSKSRRWSWPEESRASRSRQAWIARDLKNCALARIPSRSLMVSTRQGIPPKTLHTELGRDRWQRGALRFDSPVR